MPMTYKSLIINHFITIKIEHIMCSPSARFQVSIFQTYLFVSFTNDKILQTLYSIAGRFETYPYNLVWSVFGESTTIMRQLHSLPLTISKTNSQLIHNYKHLLNISNRSLCNEQFIFFTLVFFQSVSKHINNQH